MEIHRLSAVADARAFIDTFVAIAERSLVVGYEKAIGGGHGGRSGCESSRVTITLTRADLSPREARAELRRVFTKQVTLVVAVVLGRSARRSCRVACGTARWPD